MWRKKWEKRREREEKEEPSRKKGRQARSNRPNVIIGRVNTKEKRKKNERILFTYITYISFFVVFSFLLLYYNRHVHINSYNYRKDQIQTKKFLELRWRKSEADFFSPRKVLFIQSDYIKNILRRIILYIYHLLVYTLS